MFARPGDWLVVERSDLRQERRTGKIMEVRSPTGAPPYVVRWVDNDHITLVFPGPDARVLTSDELEEANRRRTQRFLELQADITGHPVDQ